MKLSFLRKPSVYAAAMAMPRPMVWTFTNAVGRAHSTDLDDAA